MNEHPDENLQQLEIDNIKALYRDASTEQPSARHDELVLVAAQAELAAARKAKVRAFPKWRVPLAIAATLMLTVALTITVEREQPGEDAAVHVFPSPAAPATRPTPAAEPTAPVQPGLERSVKPAASGAAQDRVRALDTRPDLPSESAPSSMALPRGLAVPKQPPAGVSSPAAAPAAIQSPVETKPEPAPPGAAPVEAPRLQYVPSPVESGAPRALRTKPEAPPPPTYTPTPAPAAGRPEPPAEKAKKSRADENAVELRSKSSAAPTPRTPQEWMEKIRALRRAGRDADADAALREFTAAYPDFPLPEDLAVKH